MSDAIRLHGMTFYGYHGVNPEERSLGQRFVVDLEAAVDLAAAGRSDDLADTVNYAALFRTVRDVVEGAPRNLVERVAAGIADAVLDGFVRVERVTVTVHKPEVAIKGSILDAAAVEITRERGGAGL